MKFSYFILVNVILLCIHTTVVSLQCCIISWCWCNVITDCSTSDIKYCCGDSFCGYDMICKYLMCAQELTYFALKLQAVTEETAKKSRSLLPHPTTATCYVQAKHPHFSSESGEMSFSHLAPTVCNGLPLESWPVLWNNKGQVMHHNTWIKFLVLSDVIKYSN